MGTYKMGSLLWEHKKWVIFYGNIKNGFSPKGTEKMGSLLREQTKWGSPRNVGFCVGGKGWEDGVPKKESLGGKKKHSILLTFVILVLCCR
jgi:hypothetical protein